MVAVSYDHGNLGNVEMLLNYGGEELCLLLLTVLGLVSVEKHGVNTVFRILLNGFKSVMQNFIVITISDMRVGKISEGKHYLVFIKSVTGRLHGSHLTLCAYRHREYA